MKIPALTAIEMILGLGKGLTELTPTPLDDLAVAALQSALTELERVHGSDVTKAQLESLRTTPQW